MNQEELNKKCEEKYLEVDINSEKHVVGFKQFCKAKDFKKR